MPRRQRFTFGRDGMFSTVKYGSGPKTGFLVDAIYLRPKSRKDKRATVQSIYRKPNNTYMRIKKPKRRVR